MKRREFITLLGGAAAAWPLGARAQQSVQMRRIGVLMSYLESDAEAQEQTKAFSQSLKEFGWTDGVNIRKARRNRAFLLRLPARTLKSFSRRELPYDALDLRRADDPAIEDGRTRARRLSPPYASGPVRKTLQPPPREHAT